MLVALEFLAIHPASSFLGGTFYLLFGWWVVPSAVNILLAVWVALLPRIQWTLRVLLGVLVSFVLGVNTSLPILLHLGGLPPPDVVVIRPLTVTHWLAVDTRSVVTNTDIPDDQVLAPPGVHLGGDEGCGCMYWVFNSATYAYQIQKVIDERGLSDVVGQYQFSDQLPNVAPYSKIVHFMIRFSPSPVRRDDHVDMAVDVYQGHEKVATYRQRQLPIARAGLQGRNQKLLNGHFVADVWSTLIHQGFWATLLHDRLQHDAYAAPFEAFLQQALPPAMHGNSSAGEVPVKISAAAMPMKIAEPPLDPHATVKTLKITTEKGSAVDWVTVSTNPLAMEPACSGGHASTGTHAATDTRPKGQDLAADRESDGSFEAHIVTDAAFTRIQGCQWRLSVTVKFYSKGAVVGDASVGDDIFRGSGAYQGICVSERVDYPAAKPNYFPTCFRKGLNPTDDQKQEEAVRSFAWNHVFDARVELEP